MMKPLVVCVFAAMFNYVSGSTEVCTNTLLPGAKGDQGEVGEEGDQGKVGKDGPPGLPGAPGEMGLKGEVGHTGKMGPIGDKGDKGDAGLEGPSGLKGKPGEDALYCRNTTKSPVAGINDGTTCDCGRYRKVVEQLDVNVGKLRNAVKFVKNVILGLKETEERYYLLVKESKRFGEALMNCKLREGNLAMPRTKDTNLLMAEYVSQAGLTRVFIGVQARSKDTDGTSSYVYADASPLQGFAAWSPDQELHSRVSPTTNSSCVELLSTGTWSHVECEATMFFICEFQKSRRRGGGGAGQGRGTSS